MNANPDASQLPGSTLCPKCKTTATIAHNGGQWCPHCGAFATPPDPQLTKHIQTPGPRQSPFLAPSSEGTRAGMPRCCKCQQPVDILTGLYDDGEWLCGYCILG